MHWYVCPFAMAHSRCCTKGPCPLCTQKWQNVSNWPPKCDFSFSDLGPVQKMSRPKCWTTAWCTHWAWEHSKQRVTTLEFIGRTRLRTNSFAPRWQMLSTVQQAYHYIFRFQDENDKAKLVQALKYYNRLCQFQRMPMTDQVLLTSPLRRQCGKPDPMQSGVDFYLFLSGKFLAIPVVLLLYDCPLICWSWKLCVSAWLLCWDVSTHSRSLRLFQSRVLLPHPRVADSLTDDISSSFKKHLCCSGVTLVS